MNQPANKLSFRERLAQFLGCSVDELNNVRAPSNFAPPASVHGCIRNASELQSILLRIKEINDARRLRIASDHSSEIISG
ncbi:MAG: hypothetical protein AB8G99_26420 [Planctomycetaceae bacterium]